MRTNSKYDYLRFLSEIEEAPLLHCAYIAPQIPASKASTVAASTV